jgi:2-polyprenyl-3-methyl-5-hydroxy-6-metoxy-1,4-benzoquinol methylase
LTNAYTKHYYPSNGNAAVYENTPESILRQTLQEALTKFGALGGKKLLDFGCGVGGLCRVAGEYGIQATGIEPDVVARDRACKSGSLEAYANLGSLREAQPDAKFDIVTIWDVIEHLREPWKELKELATVLRPDGWLLLSTMNAGSLRATVERERWTNMINPTHFYYFTRRSLRSMFERSGFTSIDEWRFPIRYPDHSAIRQIINRGLWACGMHGQLVFVARPRMCDTPEVDDSRRARVDVAQ